MDSETRHKAMEQEWQNFRYQDGLRWSKIQTLLAIEAALLAGIYSAPHVVTVPMQLVLAVFGTVIVCAICSLAEKDGRDATYHRNRAEALVPLANTLDVSKPANVLGINGTATMRIAMFFLIALNFAVIVEVLTRLKCA